MEARWIYREVESASRWLCLPRYRYPHTFLSQACRYAVAESHDLLNAFGFDFVGKTIWYSKSNDPSGLAKINESRKKMFCALPYMGAQFGKTQEHEQKTSRSAAEELMYKFIAKRDKVKAGG